MTIVLWLFVALLFVTFFGGAISKGSQGDKFPREARAIATLNRPTQVVEGLNSAYVRDKNQRPPH